MCFAVSHAAAHRCAHSRSVGRVHEIHVQAYGRAVGIVGHETQRLTHHVAHAALIDIAHGKNVDAGLLDQAALFRIQIAHANKRDVTRLGLRLVTEQFDQLRRAVADDRRERHAVNVARGRTFRRVHIAVRVQP